MDFSDEPSLEELTRLKLYAPSVMVPLAKNEEIQYYICFGGREAARKPISMDGIDTRDINDIYMATESKSSNNVMTPKYVFEIGRLFFQTANNTEETTKYSPTDFRFVVNAENGVVWLFYEYYQFDYEETEREERFRMDPTLSSRLHQEFDSVIVLDSIKKWDEHLKVETIEESMNHNAFMTHTLFCSMLNREPASMNIPKESSGLQNQVKPVTKGVPASKLKAPRRVSVSSIIESIREFRRQRLSGGTAQKTFSNTTRPIRRLGKKIGVTVSA